MTVDLIAEARQHIAAVHSALQETDIIDAAYHAKYDRYGPEIVGTVVGSQAHDVTIRLVPRSMSS